MYSDKWMDLKKEFIGKIENLPKDNDFVKKW
jgi:hypothetical protein